MQKGGTTYIMTNEYNNVLYIGVTNDIVRRVYEHKTHANKGSFCDKYNCTKLVWYVYFTTIDEAIREEKRLKGGNRQQKINLIRGLNPEWKDLWDAIFPS